MSLAFCFNSAFSQMTKEEEADVERLKAMPLNGFFNISFVNAVPQKEFFDNFKKSGQGFSINGGYKMSDIPLAFGAQGDIIFFGGDTKYFNYVNQGGWHVGKDTVEYQNMIIPITFFAKIEPNVGNFVFPYLEGFAGFTLLSASADYKSSLWNINDEKSELTANWNYGVGVGVKVKLVDFIQLPSMHSRMLFDVNMRYMSSSETDYYFIKQINNNTAPDFRKYSSPTDMVLFNAGITMEF